LSYAAVSLRWRLFFANFAGSFALFAVKGLPQRTLRKSRKGRKEILMELVVHSSSWCPDCRVAKRFLQGHNIPFREVDIESTPGAADEVIARTGKRAIPQFVIDGEWVQPYRLGEGFLYEEMSERLGIKEP
jgi:mycoredoxin